MKKIIFSIISILISVGTLIAFSQVTQAATDLKINLETNKTNYIFNTEPVNITITVRNESGSEVITQEHFSDKPFHLFLIFKEKYGNIITANTRGVLETPPMPGIIPDRDGDGIYEQVEGLERLAFDWYKGVGPFNAYTYYSIEPGSYLVTAQVSTRIIDPSNVITYSGKEYAQIGPGDWAGVLDADTALVCIRADRDGDGYYYPACLPGAQEDCDDTNRNIHPGATEITGNGIDDDCNPSTSDGVVTMLTVLNPNGGEVIPSGSTYEIKWTAPSNAVNFDLKYSINNGTTWKPIASKISGASYNWTVPIPKNNKKKCLVKVIGYNAVGTKIGEDTSGATFRIEVIKLTSPDGGETLSHPNAWTIRWRTNGTVKPVAFSILYYIQDGSTWKLISPRVDNLGYYPWEVPYVASARTKCKVKVVLKAADGTIVGSDISDTFFTIQP